MTRIKWSIIATVALLLIIGTCEGLKFQADAIRHGAEQQIAQLEGERFSQYYYEELREGDDYEFAQELSLAMQGQNSTLTKEDVLKRLRLSTPYREYRGGELNRTVWNVGHIIVFRFHESGRMYLAAWTAVEIN